MGALSIEEVLAEEAEAIHGKLALDGTAGLRGQATSQFAETDRSNKDADERSGRDENPQDRDKSQQL